MKKFTCLSDDYRRQLMNGKFDYWDEDEEEEGVHDWGEAVLEVGYVDIELNILADCDEDYHIINKPYPCYFICAKGIINGVESWTEVGYIDYKYEVNVDWSADDWMVQLERDMTEKLDMFVKQFELKYDEPNFSNNEEEYKLFEILNTI